MHSIILLILYVAIVNAERKYTAFIHLPTEVNDLPVIHVIYNNPSDFCLITNYTSYPEVQDAAEIVNITMYMEKPIYTNCYGKCYVQCPLEPEMILLDISTAELYLNESRTVTAHYNYILGSVDLKPSLAMDVKVTCRIHAS